MTTDPFVTITFFASVALIFIAFAVAWRAIVDYKDRQRLSREMRRLISRYHA